MTEDEMSEKESDFESMRLMEIELQDERRKLLTKYGWEQRCNFVDACWRWCKVIEGELMMCTEAQAIRIERDFLCEQAVKGSNRTP